MLTSMPELWQRFLPSRQLISAICKLWLDAIRRAAHEARALEGVHTLLLP
jgi:hypothetical protein